MGPDGRVDPAPPRPEARVEDPQAVRAEQGRRRAQVRNPPRAALQDGGQEGLLEGAQDPAPGDAATAAAQARHAALQEDPSSQGQGRGRRLPEAAQPAPEEVRDKKMEKISQRKSARSSRASEE